MHTNPQAIPAPPSDLRGVEHPSIVTESVEHHFQSMARALRSAKFNSETVVRLQELSFHVRVPRSAKPLPTVTEALASPFLQVRAPRGGFGVTDVHCKPHAASEHVR